MNLCEMVVKAGNFAFGRGAVSAPGTSVLGRQLSSKQVQRAFMLVVGLLALSLMARTMKHSPESPAAGPGRAAVASVPLAAGSTAEHLDYAPGANLEAEELAVLGKARRNIDVAMYAFTDTEIAELLARKAQAGVRVRVYRDADQYAQEQSRTYGHETTSAILRAAGVEVRVKAAGELMHMKGYAVDNSFIRTGSANWSRNGLEEQDNDVLYIQSPDSVRAFTSDFESMWNRSDNFVL
jgi:phosphatidylserine/phosphatidylglycerophosphate/cardiolipin synthase-like enzyme